MSSTSSPDVARAKSPEPRRPIKSAFKFFITRAGIGSRARRFKPALKLYITHVGSKNRSENRSKNRSEEQERIENEDRSKNERRRARDGQEDRFNRNIAASDPRGRVRRQSLVTT